MDFFIPDVPLAKLREIGLRMQIGGVGFYPTSGSPFVHMDTGSVRHWPRMTRQQLVRVFPNGNTLHVPSDGKPLPGYAEALAAYKARKSGMTADTRGRQLRAARRSSRAPRRPASRSFSPTRSVDDEESGDASNAADLPAAQQPPQRAVGVAVASYADRAGPAAAPGPEPAAAGHHRRRSRPSRCPPTWRRRSQPTDTASSGRARLRLRPAAGLVGPGRARRSRRRHGRARPDPPRRFAADRADRGRGDHRRQPAAARRGDHHRRAAPDATNRPPAPRFRRLLAYAPATLTPGAVPRRSRDRRRADAAYQPAARRCCRRRARLPLRHAVAAASRA